jgi:hypothetical protein
MEGEQVFKLRKDGKGRLLLKEHGAFVALCSWILCGARSARAENQMLAACGAAAWVPRAWFVFGEGNFWKGNNECVKVSLACSAPFLSSFPILSELFFFRKGSVRGAGRSKQVESGCEAHCFKSECVLSDQ